MLSVPLSQPVADLDRTFSVLAMREPTIADIRAWVYAAPRTIDEFICLAAQLAVIEGAPIAPETLHRLPPRDAYRIVEALTPFFAEPQKASPGSTSPASAPGDLAGLPTSSVGSGSAS